MAFQPVNPQPNPRDEAIMRMIERQRLYRHFDIPLPGQQGQPTPQSPFAPTFSPMPQQRPEQSNPFLDILNLIFGR